VTITFLGTGTSQGVPVIACGCEVCTSTDPRDKRLRTSILIEDGAQVIVIDSGPDFRYQMLRANVQKLDAIVFTHEHKDHIEGPIDVYADLRVQAALKREYSYIFAEHKYPGIPQLQLHTIGLEPFSIGKINFIPIEVMHYMLPVLGFRINDFTYITDAKTVSETEKEKIKGSKILVINALQQQSHISHFTLDEAIAFAEEIGAETTYFTHISHRLGTHEVISAVLPPHIELAYDGLKINI
jgi:phosphoribosyl 1,2-cyclic phosphate phosphodiesterase